MAIRGRARLPRRIDALHKPVSVPRELETH